MVPSSARVSEDACGDSLYHRRTFRRLSERRARGHRTRHVGPCANGRRWDVPTYVLAPRRPTRRFCAFGANPRAEDGPVNDNKEAAR